MKRALAALLALTLTAAAPAQPQDFGRIAFDQYSLKIDGKRQVIWSGEFHPFRLPSPDLWRDALQKMRAIGFNTVSIYFDWGYHSPAPGVYDFRGVRDMDRVLRMAAEEGLYVIARPGPYINAEVSRGGFPGWLVNQTARARTDDPAYLKATDEWMGAIDAIIARHQLGRGGSVILYQIENELALTTPAQRRYLDHLYAKARADGIDVPIFHNDQGRNGYWVPRGAGVPGTVEGPADLYAFDSYPGGSCTIGGEVTRTAPVPDYGRFGPGGAKGGASASPNTPGFAAEYGAGWFDHWGSNGGYDCTARQRGEGFQRIFYGANLANGITLQNFYMAYGGTSWGWLAAPVVYTSYDYGAAIDEARGLRPKAQELKQLAGLIAAVPDLAALEPAEGVTASSNAIRIRHARNPETGARFMLVTHAKPETTDNTRFTIDAKLPDGDYRFPLNLNGFDAKWLVAGVPLARQHLVYATSEVQAAIAQRAGDVVLLHGRAGDDGEAVLRFASPPRIITTEGNVIVSFDPAKGDLKLVYRHAGLARVLVEGGGRSPLTLLIADTATAAQFWQSGKALVRGPALFRAAREVKGAVELSGDSAGGEMLEVWTGARSVRWNGRAIATRTGAGGSLVATAPLPAPTLFALPDLAAAPWRVSPPSPEAAPDFDDSAWQVADNRAHAATIKPPTGQPTLSMDAYGIHHGDVTYRGRFTGGPDRRFLTVHYGAGGAGLLQLWLDGVPVGQDALPAGLASPITMNVARFALPPTAQAPGEHVLTITVRNNGHNWDLHADDAHKEPRGLISASLDDGGRRFVVPVTWRVMGAPEPLTDPVRGVVNAGGSHGERMGWHLPGFDDRAWSAARVPVADAAFGTRWYRTAFTLAIAKGDDATIGIAFGDVTQPRSRGGTRALIFVNGWNMGQFVADVGPQRVFPMPAGLLDHAGRNVIALAVTSDGAPDSVLEAVRLVTMRHVRGGVPVAKVAAPERFEVAR